MKQSDKRSYLLIAVLLIASGLALFLSQSGGKDASTFRITLRGEEYGVYSLHQDALIPVEDLCVVEVSDGGVSVRSSTCPNKNCVQHVPIRKEGETIVCLPNRLVIRIDGKSETDFVI